MKVWFKRGAIGLVAALILAVVGLAVFLLTFDPNSYKSKLEELVYNKYQRTLAVTGDIQVSLFPRIGLSLQGISLSDRNSTDTFASVDSARFAVAIWPLLFNRFVVDHVSVAGLKAWVVREKNGQFNFQDLVDGSVQLAAPLPADGVEPDSPGAGLAMADEAASLPQAAPTDLQIDIAGLDLKDSEIHVRDERKGYTLRLVKLQVNTGRMTLEQPFDVSVRGNLISEQPAGDATIEGQALIKLDSGQRAYSAQKLNLQVAGKIGDLDAKVAAIKGNLAYNAITRLLDASNLELQVQGDLKGERPIKGLEFNLTMPRMRIDRSRSELNIEKLSLRSKGGLPAQSFELALDAPRLSVSPESAKGEPVSGSLKLSGASVLGLSLGASGLGGNADVLTLKELKVEGGLKQGGRALRFNMSSPVQWDTVKELGVLSAIKGDVKIESDAPSSAPFEFPLIGSVHLDRAKDELGGEINAVLSGSPLNLNVKATQLADPKVQFALQADALDFDKLFPPVSAAKPEVKPEVKPEAKLETAEGKPAEASAGKPGAKGETRADSKPAITGKAAPAASAAAPAPAQAGATADAAAARKAAEATKPGPATEAAPVPVVAAEPAIDLSLLDLLDLTGTIKIGEIKGRGLEAKKFSLAVKAADGKLDLSKMAAELYEGKLSGRITANSKNAVGAQVALDGVAVGPLFKGLTGKQLLSGTGALKLNLKAQGDTLAAMQAGLGGTVQAQVRNGAITGIDVEQTLGQVSSVLQSLLDEQVPALPHAFDLGSQTAFSSLDLNMALDQGTGQIKKLDLSSPALRITQGNPARADLVAGTLDLLVDVRVVNAGKAIAANFAGLQGVTIPVLVSGPFNALNYQVQWKSISGRLARQALQNGLLNLITEKAGPGETEAAQPKGDPVKSLGKALKGLLRP